MIMGLKLLPWYVIFYNEEYNLKNVRDPELLHSLNTAHFSVKPFGCYFFFEITFYASLGFNIKLNFSLKYIIAMNFWSPKTHWVQTVKMNWVSRLTIGNCFHQTQQYRMIVSHNPQRGERLFCVYHINADNSIPVSFKTHLWYEP